MVLAVGKAKRISASRFVSRLILSYRLFFEDAGKGELTRFARPSGSLLAGSSSVQLAAPLLSPSLDLAPSGPEQALFKNAPGVFVSNPGRWFSSPLGLGDI
ncbi:hypothetical protein FVJ30_19885 [Salmonella enterica subsp. enterica serovar Enteritidis]|uniref:Uncharacterized protein n=50 Tax=Salmonella enterica TaxID=28901 RepID=A0A724AS45_SALEP|nr:hypothetical protein AV70_25910 [Salmonella enterica subsp. enterica serovar Enteritidis str. EC20121175]AHO08599.1 hypothetical protein AV73_03985 [Salmonella enterica subsp. enterica serovar Enteritidis str. EC20121178]AHO16628.1 hypothetical protein AV74_23150 [Salmonella enterica subsp. enterica serovar Enteritidis str. EC20121179]AHO18121.1 hypothetical protein AV75_01655 [Salmonella enterica subsp. enterica serovar Enteritidis str. EC20121180]AHO23554.1 hypothetical protein AU53_03300 